MTSPNPLTRQDLLELAALDALGLLDEFDSAHYTRSFHDAPTTVQDEIKLRQAELASDRTLLPEEGPPPSLRQRVLDGVAEAVEQNDQELAPLAQIGQRYRATVVSSAEGFGQTSAPFWRAAVFVLAAAVVVLAYFAADAYRQGNLIAVAALTGNTTEQLEKMIGPTFKDFLLDGNAELIAFAVRSLIGEVDLQLLWPVPAAQFVILPSRRRIQGMNPVLTTPDDVNR